MDVWLCCVFLAVCGPPPAAANGAALHCGVWGWCLLPSRGTGSRLEEYSGCGSWALEHELSRRGVQA